MGEVAAVEKDRLEIFTLRERLEDIVYCYMDDDTDHINAEKFQLLLKNTDVLQTLLSCGTDLDGLFMLSDILFPNEGSEISITQFFSVIVRLRAGKPASVSDIIGLQEFTNQRLNALELLLEGERRFSATSSANVSVFRGTSKFRDTKCNDDPITQQNRRKSEYVRNIFVKRPSEQD